MALNSSGPISLGGTTAGQSIALENGGSGTSTISLNDAAVRSLAGVPSGAIIMPTNFYGKSNAIYFIQFLQSFGSLGSAYDSSGNVYISGIYVNKNAVVKINAAATTITAKSFSSGGYITGNYRMAAMTPSGSIVALSNEGGLDFYTASTMVFSGARKQYGTLSGMSYLYGGSSMKSAVGAPNGAFYTTNGTGFDAFCSTWEAWGVASMNSSGSINWYLSFGSSSSEPRSVGTDPNSNVYTSGRLNALGAGQMRGAWIRYNSGGGAPYGYGFLGTTDTNSITGDSSGNVYTASIGTGDAVGIVVKQNSSGTILWARIINSAGTSGVTRFSSYNLAIDSSGNVYVTAYATTPNTSFVCVGIIKYNSSGIIQWGRKLYLGTSGGGSQNLSIPQKNNSIYITPSGTMSITAYVGSSGAGVTVALPTDGSKTGTYTVTSLGSITYEAYSWIEANASGVSFYNPFYNEASMTSLTAGGQSLTAGVPSTITVTTQTTII